MAFCAHCGTNRGDAPFCPACGTRAENPIVSPTVSSTDVPAVPLGQGTQSDPFIGNRIDAESTPETDVEEFARFDNTRTREEAPGLYLCGDGRYRWAYELNLWKNPVQLIALIKCLALTVGILAVILFVIILAQQGLSEAMAFLLPFSGIALAGMLGLGLVAYALMALYLGRYCVLNVMDERGVTVYQFPKQCEKMQVIGWLCVLAGIAEGSMAQTMLGLQTMARRETQIEFDDLSTVTVAPRQDTLKLRNGPIFSHVYADKGQLAFVLAYFRARTSPSVKYRGGGFS